MSKTTTKTAIVATTAAAPPAVSGADLAALIAARQAAGARVTPAGVASRAALAALNVPRVEIVGNALYPIRPAQIPAARAELEFLEARDEANEAEAKLRAALDANDGDRLGALAAMLREGHADIIELEKRAAARLRELYAGLDQWRSERATIARDREAAGLPLPVDAPDGGNLVEIRQRLDAQIARPPIKTNVERRRQLANAIATTSAQLERDAREREEEARAAAKRKEADRLLAEAHAARMRDVAAAEVARQAAERAEKEALAAAWTARGIVVPRDAVGTRTTTETVAGVTFTVSEAAK